MESWLYLQLCPYNQLRIRRVCVCVGGGAIVVVQGFYFKNRVNCPNRFVHVRNVTAFGYASWVSVVSAACRVSSMWSALWNVDCPGCQSCVVVISGKIWIWEVYSGAHTLRSVYFYFLTIFPAPHPFSPLAFPFSFSFLPCPQTDADPKASISEK